MSLRTALVIDGDSSGAQRAVAQLSAEIDRAERGAGKSTGAASGAAGAIGREAAEAAAEFGRLDEAIDRARREANAATGAAGAAATGIGREASEAAAGFGQLDTAIEAVRREAATAVGAAGGAAAGIERETKGAVSSFRALEGAIDATAREADQASKAIGVATAGMARDAHAAAGAFDNLGDAIASSGKGAGQASRGVGTAASEMAREAQRAAAGIGAVGNSSKLASHHAQNLAAQFTDVAISLQGGQKPLTVLLQQGSTIAAIMGQAGIGVGGLAKHVAGMAGRFIMAHPAMLAVGAAAGVAMGGLALFNKHVKETGELDKFTNSLGLSKKELKELGPLTVGVGDVFSGLWKTISDALGLDELFKSVKTWAVDAFETMLEWGQNAAAGIYAFFVGAYNGLKATWSSLPAVIGEAAINAANAGIAGIEALINGSIGALNSLIGKVNSIAGTSIEQFATVDIGRIENVYSGAGAAAADAFVSSTKAAYAQAKAGMKAIGGTLADNIVDAAKDRYGKKAKELIDGRAAKTAGESGGRKIADEAAKAFKARFDEATRYLAGLDKSIAEFGKTAIQIHEMEVAAAAAAAPTKELAAQIERSGAALGKLMLDKVNADFDTYIKGLENENALIGLVGEARDRAALALEEEAFKAARAAEGIKDVNAAWERYLRTRTAGIDRQSALDRDAAAAERLAGEIDGLMTSLSGLGSVGGVLSKVLGVATGNTSNIGGVLGAVLNTAIGTKDVDGKLVAKTLGDELRRVFGMSGEFGQTLAKTLQAASTGIAAGQAAFGRRGAASDAGGALGGIVGGIAGEAFKGAITGVASKAFGKAIGSALGTAVPVVGQVLGGIIGNAIGGLFGGGAKSANAMVSGTGVGLKGSDTANYGAASDLGSAVFKGLQEIAGALDGKLGQFFVSIGLRDGEIRVNPNTNSLRGRDGGIGFGDDQAKAIAFALRDAIADGAITGIRESTARLLKGGDVEAQLQKALSFENVFKALKEATDPAGAALDKLNAEFEKLKAIFDEAGASAEERGQLDQLYAKRKADLDAQFAKTDETAGKRRELEIALMAALGDASGALAAARADELAQLDPTLRALQEQVWAAQLSNERRELEIRLMEAQGDASGALAARREIELAATDASLRGTLSAIWAAEDAAAAQGQLAQAQAAAADTARRIADQRQQLEIELMTALGDATGALAAKRQLELAGLDPSLQAIQRQIWAATDATAAQLALAQAQDAAAATARASAQARRQLEIELMEAVGDAAGAVAAQRADTLAALGDDGLRQLQQQVWAARDAAAANAALADAQAAAARAAEDAAAAVAAAAAQASADAAALGRQRSGLQSQLYRATGRVGDAVALDRQLELEGLDASLHDLQRQVWAAEDAAAAAAEAAAAQAAAQAAANDAMRAAADLARQRRGFEAQLLELQGDAAGALAIQRELALDGLDASLHALQRQVWALEDARAAEEARAAAIATARDELTAAHGREAAALKETGDRFRAFGQDLREFRAGLMGGASATADAYRAAQVKFLTTSALAAAGDEKGLSGLKEAGSAFLEASRARAGSLEQYQRDVAAVARAVDAGIAASDGAVDVAEAQLAALDRSVEKLITIDAGVQTVAQAMARLEAAMAVRVETAAVPTIGRSGASADAVLAGQRDMVAAVERMETRLTDGFGNLLRDAAATRRIWERADDGDGLRVVMAS